MTRTGSAAILLGTAISLLLAGCGRRGELDTPYQAAVDARGEASRNKQPVPPEPTPPNPDRPFILDPLI